MARPMLSVAEMRLAAMIVALAACSDAASGLSSLVATQPAPASACPGGGVEIDTGVDTDGDGVLEASEITMRSDLCSPPAAGPTPAEVVRVVPEDAGANCPDGGVAVETGTDANGNGVLDDGEVSATTYVCSGADGANGSDGTDGSDGHDGANGDILVRVVTEPPGDNCATGGEAIEVGVDTNDDGSLEPDEVQTVAFACGVVPTPNVIVGNYIVNNDVDLAALQNVTEISGTLTFATTAIPSISLPNLTHAGAIGFSAGPISSLSFPALLTVGDEHGPGPFAVAADSFDLPNLRSADIGIDASDVSLPALENGSIRGTVRGTSFSTSLVNGSVLLFPSPNLTTISLPDLQTGSVELIDVPNVSTLALPAMTSGSVVITHDSPHGPGETALTSISLPSLVSGQVQIITGQNQSPAPSLTALELPLFQDGSISIEGTSLTALSLPSMESGGLQALIAPQLATIDVPKLTSLTSLNFQHDPHVATCFLQALAAATHATFVTIVDTDDAASCP